MTAQPRRKPRRVVRVVVTAVSSQQVWDWLLAPLGYVREPDPPKAKRGAR